MTLELCAAQINGKEPTLTMDMVETHVTILIHPKQLIVPQQID